MPSSGTPAHCILLLFISGSPVSFSSRSALSSVPAACSLTTCHLFNSVLSSILCCNPHSSFRPQKHVRSLCHPHLPWDSQAGCLVFREAPFCLHNICTTPRGLGWNALLPDKLPKYFHRCIFCNIWDASAGVLFCFICFPFPKLCAHWDVEHGGEEQGTCF